MAASRNLLNAPLLIVSGLYEGAIALNAYISYNISNKLDEPLIAFLAVYVQHSEYSSFQKRFIFESITLLEECIS